MWKGIRNKRGKEGERAVRKERKKIDELTKSFEPNLSKVSADNERIKNICKYYTNRAILGSEWRGKGEQRESGESFGGEK